MEVDDDLIKSETPNWFGDDLDEEDVYKTMKPFSNESKRKSSFKIISIKHVKKEPKESKGFGIMPAGISQKIKIENVTSGRCGSCEGCSKKPCGECMQCKMGNMTQCIDIFCSKDATGLKSRAALRDLYISKQLGGKVVENKVIIVGGGKSKGLQPSKNTIDSQDNSKSDETEANPESHPCSECGKVFTRKYYLNRHFALRHKKVDYNNFLCQDCGQNFNRESKLM